MSFVPAGLLCFVLYTLPFLHKSSNDAETLKVFGWKSLKVAPNESKD